MKICNVRFERKLWAKKTQPRPDRPTSEENLYGSLKIYIIKSIICLSICWFRDQIDSDVPILTKLARKVPTWNTGHRRDELEKVEPEKSPLNQKKSTSSQEKKAKIQKISQKNRQSAL